MIMNNREIQVNFHVMLARGIINNVGFLFLWQVINGISIRDSEHATFRVLWISAFSLFSLFPPWLSRSHMRPDAARWCPAEEPSEENTQKKDLGFGTTTKKQRLQQMTYACAVLYVCPSTKKIGRRVSRSVHDIIATTMEFKELWAVFVQSI